MISSETLAAITSAILLLLLLLKQYKRVTSSSSGQREEQPRRRQLPPGPAKTLPFIGNMHQMMMISRSKQPVFRWIHGLLEETGDGDILCLRLGAVHVVAVACPEIAREVLRHKDAAFASRPATFASGAFSFGYKGSILSPHGEQWKKMRRVLVSELLSPSMERQLQHLRDEEAGHLVRHMCTMWHNNGAGGGAVNLRHMYVTQHHCGNTVRRLVFGKRNFGGEPPASSSSSSGGAGPGRDEVAHVEAIFTLLGHVYMFCLSDYVPALVGLDVDGHEKVVQDVMRTVNRLHDPIIDERIRQQCSRRGGDEKREARDFLDVLVSLEDAQGRPSLSIDDIRAQTLEIIFATVENPSNAVEWALAEMMNKPHIMQKAVDELDAVVGKDRLVQESDIPELNYLKACIREAFRLHPYLAFIPPHVATADTTVAGYMIPKDTHVIISRLALGRNPKTWTEPLEFLPERHLNDSNNNVLLLSEPDLRFISFGTGRRGCPGISLGTSITMMLFARILQGFTLMKPPGVDRINLRESKTGLALAEPLLLQAKPRLAAHLYGAN